MGLSSAFASAVETGAKSIPSDFVQKVVAALDLTASQRVKLEEAAEASAKEIRIPLSNASRADREVAAMFARRFPDMPASRKADLRKLLEEIEE
jgi:hypothetical protein